MSYNEDLKQHQKHSSHSITTCIDPLCVSAVLIERKRLVTELIHYTRLHLKFPQLITHERITETLNELDMLGVSHTCKNCDR